MTKGNVETGIHSDGATIVEGQSGEEGAEDIVLLMGTTSDRPGRSLQIDSRGRTEKKGNRRIVVASDMLGTLGTRASRKAAYASRDCPTKGQLEDSSDGPLRISRSHRSARRRPVDEERTTTLTS